MMKPKFFVLFIFLWLLAACTPDAIVPTPEAESRPTALPTVQPTATAEAAKTAVPPTAELPDPTPEPETAEPTLEPTAFTPRFDIFLSLDGREGGSGSLTGLVLQEDGWQIDDFHYPLGLYSVDTDYAVATDRLLTWDFAGGAGPGSLAVGQLSIVDVATKEQTVVVPENVVSAGWAPNGLDFAYILATPTTYELRWRTAGGEDRLLAVDVPHSLRVSPDGRFVAFTRESHYKVDSTPPGLYIVEISTGLETQVSPLDRAGYGGTGLFWKPHWTPDSRQLFLYAVADDNRAPEPHPAGYVWAAIDGSFAHFVPESAFLEFFADEPVSDPENRYRCLGSPPLLTANGVVMGVGECQLFSSIPETAQAAYFMLDSQTGAVTLVRLLPVPDSAQLLAWDVPGESVFILVEGVVTQLAIE